MVTAVGDVTVVVFVTGCEPPNKAAAMPSWTLQDVLQEGAPGVVAILPTTIPAYGPESYVVVETVAVSVLTVVFWSEPLLMPLPPAPPAPPPPKRLPPAPPAPPAPPWPRLTASCCAAILR